MGKVSFPLRPISPPHLAREIATALSIPTPYVDVYADRLEVVGTVDESVREAISAVLAAHDATPPASDEEVARGRLRDLKRKGWANLTAAERAEVAQRLLELVS